MRTVHRGVDSIARPLATLCGCVLLFASTAAAEPVAISGSGTVTEIDQSAFTLLTGFNAAEGDPFSFAIRYDTVSADADPAPDSGSFLLSGGQFVLSFPQGRVSVTGPLSGTTAVVSPRFDDTLLNLRSGAQSGLMLDLLAIDVEGDDNWRSTDAWPSDLVTTLRQAPRLEVGVRHVADDSTSRLIELGPVEELAGGPTPVPEPSTLMLIAAGVLGPMTRMARAARRRAVLPGMRWSLALRTSHN